MAKSFSQREVDVLIRQVYQSVGTDKFFQATERAKRAIDNAEYSLEKWGKTGDKVAKSFDKLENILDSTIQAATSVFDIFAIGTLSYKGIIKYNFDLNRSLIATSAQFAKFGINVGMLESKVESFAKRNNMLRTEVVRLAGAFEKAFIAGGGNFEGFLKMMQLTVGNNVEAMQDLMQQISAIGQEYIGFQRILTSADKDTGRLTEGNKRLAEALYNMGEASGRMPIGQRKALADLLAGQERLAGGGIPDKRRTELEKQIDAIRAMEKASEDISRAMNEKVMPALEKISSLLQSINFASWAPSIIVAVTGLRAAWGLLRGISAFAAKAGLPAAGAAGAAGARSGAVGGLFAKAGSYLGTTSGSAVRFVKSPASLGFGALGGLGGIAGSAIFENNYRSRNKGQDPYDTLAGSMGKFGSTVAGGAIGGVPGIVSATMVATVEAGNHARIAINYIKKDMAAARVNAEKISDTFIKMYESEKTNAKTSVQARFADAKIKLEEMQKDLDKLQQKDAGFFNQLLGGGESSATEDLKSKMSEQRRIIGQFAGTVKEEKKQESLAAITDARRQEQSRQIDIQRQNVDATNMLLQEQTSYYSTIVERMGLIGSLSDNNIENADKERKIVLKRIQDAKNQNQELIKQEEERIQKAKELMATANEAERAEALKAIKEYESEIVKRKREIAALTKQELDAYRAQQRIFEARQQLADAEVNVTQAQISLADNLAMGVAASARMRLEAVEKVGASIAVEQNKMKMIESQIREVEERRSKATTEDEMKSIAADLLGLTTDRANAEASILNKQQQQAQLLRALRDGYISAINAMNTGAGVFSKIIIDQNKNMGILMRQGLSPTGILTGSSQGGFTTSERFTPTGISSRRGSPIVNPEWGLSTGLSGISGIGTLGNVASQVQKEIPNHIKNMSGDMASAAANVSNISRLLGERSAQDPGNYGSARGAAVGSITGRAVQHIQGIQSGLSTAEKKEIVNMLAKDIRGLVIEALSAAKEDIMSDIAKGIG